MGLGARPKKLEERAVVLRVRGAKRLDISLARVFRVQRISLSPRENLSAELFHQQVRHHPRMPPVSVRKWLDLGEPMMKSHGDFLRGHGAGLDLLAHFIQKTLERRGDVLRGDADFLLALAVRPRPSPNAPEHPSMELLHISPCENVALAGGGPLQAFRDGRRLELEK